MAQSSPRIRLLEAVEFAEADFHKNLRVRYTLTFEDHLADLEAGADLDHLADLEAGADVDMEAGADDFDLAHPAGSM